MLSYCLSAAKVGLLFIPRIFSARLDQVDVDVCFGRIRVHGEVT
jgi:hypothetical protein